MARVESARSKSDFSVARELFEEYAARLGVDLCFQGFNSELARLDTMYAPPQGSLLLAWHGDEAVGCVGVRKLSATVCEMKRLYVRGQVRGLGIGRQLALEVLARARELRYERMVLDTLEGMSEARGLYASLGFRECAAYYDNPLAGVVYMAIDLVAPVPAPLGAAGSVEALKERR